MAINEPKSAVLLLSGGLDSMVTGGIARELGYRLFALTIDYNQRHRIELEAADESRGGARRRRRHIVTPARSLADSAARRSPPISTSRKTGVGEDIPITYVPARNTIFLSLCLGWAEVVEARDIFIGVNALDYSGYPDCRPDFVASFEAMANLATKAGVEGDRFSLYKRR